MIHEMNIEDAHSPVVQQKRFLIKQMMAMMTQLYGENAATELGDIVNKYEEKRRELSKILNKKR